MAGEACPINQAGGDDAKAIRRMLGGHTIAVVGLSSDPDRPSHHIASYLQSAGYAIVPVTPTYPEVLGQKSYPAIDQVPGKIDVVLVFRRPEFAAQAARDAVAAGAQGLWLQAGIQSREARQIATAAGLDYVENRCMMVEHRHQKFQ